jgi:Leucine-rich repeat (LRR) protein
VRFIAVQIFQLSEELKLVSFGNDYGWSHYGMPCLKLSNLLVYKKFLEKVLRKNPDFDIYSQERDDYDSVSFPKVPIVSFTLRRIRVLSLHRCRNLECADLSEFPKLRSLAITECRELKSVIGWEVVKELGWLQISDCRCYEDFPRVQSLPSLRELRLSSNRSSALQVILVPDLSQRVRLRRLEIWGSDSSALNSVDLSTLRFLEVLKLWECSALTTIQGLSGLHSLTELNLSWCEALRRVPELGCLKALTHLDMLCCGVEEIPGVQELHLLTKLHLYACSSLKTLPWLGHLKALAYLDIRWSGVEEIPGVEDLVSLETLYCTGSRLKGLPDLHHLPRLREVVVEGTPLTTMEPSSLYYGKRYLEYTSHGKAERMGFVDEISDISDTEYNHSDDDGEDSC